MENLIQQISDSGGILVVLIPSIVQILKKVPFFTKLQVDGFPAYQLISIGLGIGGAYVLGLASPIITGIVAGLAAGKGYDIVKGTK